MGTLYIVSTPIGNLEDITIRAIKTLFSVDIIACEDTRRTGILLKELQSRFTPVLHSTKVHHPSLLRLDDYTENKTASEIINALQNGKHVALVSDSGTPLISDPGYKLVSECIKRGIKVVSIPGPTAAIAALTSSGLPTNRFLFLGYPPEKQSSRENLFQSLPKNTTIIFYCAPHKLRQTLEDFKKVTGDIPIIICRELTKIHEEIWRGNLSSAFGRFNKPVGEFVILLQLQYQDTSSLT